jgi:hypothetical protein
MNKLALVCGVVVVSSFAGVAFGEGEKEKPATVAAPTLPPEVKKTVDAMAGTWVWDGTVTGMGKDPIKVKETFVCKKAAGGRAVSCNGKGSIPGMGNVEDEALVAYDVEGKAIRFVGFSSTGEVHDHKCIWKDEKTMTCDPLAVTVGGAPASVTLSMSFPDAKTMVMNETTTGKDGSKVAFDGKGKRR